MGKLSDNLYLLLWVVIINITGLGIMETFDLLVLEIFFYHDVLSWTEIISYMVVAPIALIILIPCFMFWEWFERHLAISARKYGGLILHIISYILLFFLARLVFDEKSLVRITLLVLIFALLKFLMRIPINYYIKKQEEKRLKLWHNVLSKRQKPK